MNLKKSQSYMRIYLIKNLNFLSAENQILIQHIYFAAHFFAPFVLPSGATVPFTLSLSPGTSLFMHKLTCIF
jgi:hypothetical protein